MYFYLKNSNRDWQNRCAHCLILAPIPAVVAQVASTTRRFQHQTITFIINICHNMFIQSTI